LFNKDFEHLERNLQKEFALKQVDSIKDLAEILREGNVELKDQTFVYCSDGTEGEEFRHALRLIKSETNNPVCYIKHGELAKEMRMKPGVFYCYYKPSYVNGYSTFIGQNVDFPYLQAYEGVCRDEF
jgi:hypothetical protein